MQYSKYMWLHCYMMHLMILIVILLMMLLIMLLVVHVVDEALYENEV